LQEKKRVDLKPCNFHTQVLSHLYSKENGLQVPMSAEEKNLSLCIMQKYLDAVGIAASTFADKISPDISTDSSIKAACVTELC
jgi:hypothetical protein